MNTNGTTATHGQLVYTHDEAIQTQAAPTIHALGLNSFSGLNRYWLPFTVWKDDEGAVWRVDVLGDGTAVTWCVDE